MPDSTVTGAVSATDALSQSIRQRVLDGVYEPGERLKESVLAQEFGVARHTLRSALTRVQDIGLLTFRPNHGWSVPTYSDEDFTAMQQFRCALESQAVWILAERDEPLPTSVYTALEDLRSIDPSSSWLSRLDSDLMFHLALVEASNSRIIQERYRGLHDSMNLMLKERGAWGMNLAFDEWLSHHELIVDVIENRTPVEALQAIHSDIETAA